MMKRARVLCECMCVCVVRGHGIRKSPSAAHLHARSQVTFCWLCEPVFVRVWALSLLAVGCWLQPSDRYSAIGKAAVHPPTFCERDCECAVGALSLSSLEALGKWALQLAVLQFATLHLVAQKA
ncbi:hypothetical protein GQ42DRAFT_162152 [Ramicandelaber brevisporus]|nr:hypothetical protein GQ42DRAFT_162152 [Ramicandelaber brevisporus]